MRAETMEWLNSAHNAIDDCCVFTHDQITLLQEMISCIGKAIDCESEEG